ncbi:hypothetical protein CDL15_Pgr028302 [Punica granatum]|nr:hypothetical protein CDL15_Pgr028302 [Punica granatum]PKI38037.1 hypothetical protein CRG98_041567 [Punica granatum]
MGRPINNNHHQPVQVQSTVTHFSHSHPLHVFSSLTHTLAGASCSACKVGFSPGSTVYGCTACSFFLHASCSKLPQQIQHPVDVAHILFLLPVPIYPQGFFNCNACGKDGNGFLYHCGVCNIYLHTICASMPLTWTHQSHPHQVSLNFSAPYPNKIFSCDICGMPGTREWLYRCNPCGFDSHLLCAGTSNVITREAAPVESYYTPQPPTPSYQQEQYNLAAQNLIQQQLLEQQGATVAISRVQMQYNQPVASVPGRNLRATNNVNYFRGNQLRGLFAGLQGMLGNSGGGGSGSEMSDLGNGSSGGVAGDSGGGGLDFGSGLGDLGNLGGFDLGSLGGMDIGSLGDHGGGGVGDFDF